MLKFISTSEKREYIERESFIKEIRDEEEVILYVCPFCGEQHEEDLSSALSCCHDDCDEQLEELRQDFRYDQEMKERIA